MGRGVLKWTVRIHKWIALIIGVQILLWILGGFVFSVLKIEKVRGEHKAAEWTIQPFDPANIVSLQSAAENAGITAIKEAELGTMMGRPVWRISVAGSDHGGHDHVMTLDGRTGRVLSPISEALATQIAKADYIGKGEFVSIEFIEDPPDEYPKKAWAAKFNDLDNTTLYIHPNTGEVKARRSTTWRVFDFFWRLHVMDYDDGESFNHPLLIVSAFIALFVALSGLLLLFIKMRRLILMRRARSQSD